MGSAHACIRQGQPASYSPSNSINRIQLIDISVHWNQITDFSYLDSVNWIQLTKAVNWIRLTEFSNLLPKFSYLKSLKGIQLTGSKQRKFRQLTSGNSGNRIPLRETKLQTSANWVQVTELSKLHAFNWIHATQSNQLNWVDYTQVAECSLLNSVNEIK